jgi:hypothetical protein
MFMITQRVKQKTHSRAISQSSKHRTRITGKGAQKKTLKMKGGPAMFMKTQSRVTKGTVGKRDFHPAVTPFATTGIAD